MQLVLELIYFSLILNFLLNNLFLLQKLYFEVMLYFLLGAGVYDPITSTSSVITFHVFPVTVD